MDHRSAATLKVLKTKLSSGKRARFSDAVAAAAKLLRIVLKEAAM